MGRVGDPRDSEMGSDGGGEGEGLSYKTIAEADYVVRIPMAHGEDSLNVATAAAVAFWQLRITDS